MATDSTIIHAGTHRMDNRIKYTRVPGRLNSLYIEVYRWILKCMYGASQDFGCRVCFWSDKIPPTDPPRSTHSLDFRAISSPPLSIMVRHEPVDFPDIAGPMAHHSPVRSRKTQTAAPWTIMRHEPCNVGKTHRPTVH